jgi:hypothetical protein
VFCCIAFEKKYLKNLSVVDEAEVAGLHDELCGGHRCGLAVRRASHGVSRHFRFIARDAANKFTFGRRMTSLGLKLFKRMRQICLFSIKTTLYP